VPGNRPISCQKYHRKYDTGFAQLLIGKARKLYAEDPFGVELDHTVYALDSRTIDRLMRLS